MKSCVGGIGMPRKRWFGIVRQKFLRLSPRHRRETIIVLHTNNTLASSSFAVTVEGDAEEVRDDLEVICEQTEVDAPSSPPTPVPEEDTLTMSTEDNAATMIQAHFRGHLARRAYKALRSLVKLQAVVRGVLVRSQARLALDCMHALARLQVTVRARQLLGNCPATPTY